ncbi:MAG: HD family phosphohydrolase [Cyclonatronaceae bacterium]
MSFLEKLHLGRKKNAPKASLNEKAQQEEQQQRRSTLLLRLLISLSFLVLVMLLYPRDISQQSGYELNEPWKDEDLTAPFDFSILKTDAEIEQEIRQIRENTPPIFHIDPRIPPRVLASADSLMQDLSPLLEAYADWQRARMMAAQTEPDTSKINIAISDSLHYVRMRAREEYIFDAESLGYLLDNYAEAVLFDETGDFVGNDIRNRVSHLINEVYRDGIISISKDQLETDELSVRNLQERTERFVNLANVRDMEEARDFISFRLTRMMRPQAADVGIQLFQEVIEPDLRYREQATREKIQEGIAGISPTKGAVASGQVIIRRGDLITEERLNVLRSLEAAQTSRASTLELGLRVLGDFLLLAAMLATFMIYLYLYRTPIFDDLNKFSLVFIALFLVIGANAFLLRIESVSAYMVPLALAPIILTIFFDSRVGILATISIALMTGLMNGYDYEFMAATLVASSIGIYSVRDIRQRNQYILKTPGLIFTAYAFVLLGFTLSRAGGWDTLGMNLVYVFVNITLISILTYQLIFLFEKLFNLTTDVTLYELNDNNNPILKELMSKAPGSFQHSIQVANLAESAASAINANSLLARVGGLYHDIGKMEKPQYFVENQVSGINPHNELSPSMSAKIIREHVKAGIKRAKEEDLPPIIIKFIETHHGNSLIQFFYDKALKEASNNKEVDRSFFRYDGPLPDTKETGILLLADCVEAASRAMKDPSYKKLENLINNLVNARVEEQQLIKCPLTFHDVTLIKEAFLKNLLAIYHSRIKYPNQDKNEADNEADNEDGQEKKKSSETPPAAPASKGSDTSTS